jgi:hypothetical protein
MIFPSAMKVLSQANAHSAPKRLVLRPAIDWGKFFSGAGKFWWTPDLPARLAEWFTFSAKWLACSSGSFVSLAERVTCPSEQLVPVSNRFAGANLAARRLLAGFAPVQRGYALLQSSFAPASNCSDLHPGGSGVCQNLPVLHLKCRSAATA